MTQESMRPNERGAALAIFTKLMSELANLESFREQDSINPNYSLVEDFRSLTVIAGLAKKFNLDPDSWHQKIIARRKNLKDEFIEANDIISAIEIDKIYAVYLLGIGNKDDAIQIVNTITDEYNVTKPLPPNEGTLDRAAIFKYLEEKMTYDQFQDQPSLVRIDFACEMIRIGDADGASEQVKSIDLLRYGFGYFSELLEHYKGNRDIEMLKKLAMDIEKVISNHSDDESSANYKSYLNYLIRETKDAATKFDGRDIDFEYEKEVAWKIENAKQRITALVTIVKKMSQDDKINEAIKLGNQILEEITKNTSESSNDERLTAQELYGDEIGSLAFLPNKKNYSYELDTYDNVHLRLALANALAEETVANDLINRIVGDDLFEIIDLTDFESGNRFYTKLFEFYARRNKLEKIKDLYNKCIIQRQGSFDLFTKYYALAIYSCDSGEALSAIEKITDPEMKIEALAGLFFLRIDQEGLNKWQKLINEIVKLEDEILVSQEEPGFSIGDIFNLDVNSGPQDKEQFVEKANAGNLTISLGSPLPERKFYRRSPELLALLAKYALEKGKFDIVNSALNHEHQITHFKIEVLKFLAKWLEIN